MQPQSKGSHAAALGQRGGQKRMEQLTVTERSILARYTVRSRWHPQEAKEKRERALEITNLVKQARKD